MSDCRCFRWLLLAVDEYKAHREYSGMGETDKAGDELRHYEDFRKKIQKDCPKEYRAALEDLSRCVRS